MDTSKIENSLASNAGLARRGLMRHAGLLAATLGTLSTIDLMANPAAAQTATLTDPDLLNFALNLEYLEAEFYQRAAYGHGIPVADVHGVGRLGHVTGGQKVPFKSPMLQQFANEIAGDELKHVLFLRSALGSAAVARPAIDLSSSFHALAHAAGLVGPTGVFDPFYDENSFLLGAFIFEDVGVTAYNGAAPAITSKAYHAAEIRTLLYEKALYAAASSISALRATASGAADDQGIRVSGKANIVPADSNGLAFARTPQQVLSVVYLGGASASYGFFPNKMNGTIS